MQQKVINTRTKREEHTGLLEMIRHKYQPYWPLFVIASIISFSIAYVYLKYATPLYKMSSSLLIKEDARAVESSIIEMMDPLGSGKKIENEIEILKSRTIAKAVVRHLNLYGEIFERGTIRDVSMYKRAPVQITFLDPDQIDPMEGSILDLKYDYNGRKLTMGDKTYPLNDTVTTTRWGRILITPTPGFNPASLQNKQLYIRIAGEKALAGAFLGNLKIAAANKQSNVLRLEYVDAVPQKGMDMLNELMRTYDAESIEDKNKTASKTMSFVEDRLRIITAELSQVEGQIERYKTSEGIVDIGEQGKMFLASVQDNDVKLSEADMQLSTLEAVEQYVRNKHSEENVVPATIGIADQTLLTLLGKLQDIELQQDKLRKTTGENSPALESLAAQEERIRPAIMDNIRSLRANLEAGRAKLAAQNTRFMALLKGVPNKERTLLEVSRQQAIKNNIYTFLLEKREETALQYAAAISDSRIVDLAEADTFPFSPKKSMVMALAIIAGLAAVAGFIAVKDMMNHKVMFRSDIEKGTSAPIIAEIMFDKSGGIAITEGRRTPVAEQFRALRTTLSYIGINGDNKTILVTSSISGEGKSFIAVNLGLSLSLTKKKVVLLEFDLRKPKVSKILNVPHHPGISNYLAGHSSLNDILKQPIENNEYMYLLSAGVIPPNPTELILNGRLEHLLATLRASFDYIIIDTAPVGPVTDARLLAPYADATLYVVRHERTPKFNLKMIEDLYEQGDLGKLNIVFNGLKMRGVPGYAYGYGGGYGYGSGQGYGYGYTDDHKNGAVKKGRFTKIFK
ncbi:polysaccharide biosynthesis tyrosine autokinase [Chitinophaga filiformis]|uniref:GumC family protein n=1 Tax=Chitinophaga filiformis TaxID=104663 RepID=UPI001F434B5A|nr:polysaccharide biosynthesis tyrosine autokinase [Chitinophaga filiformis]MCF6402767.1 polysaccharide biosynthesis tyrosine autokinase [Chitinophaga filiformis]MCF6403315.1 polysaccharide biosynthesis tyrosine autokinase [Chitinophaga filiformis]